MARRILMLALVFSMTLPFPGAFAADEQELPVPVRRIERGEVIRKSDLRLEVVEERQVRPDSVRDESGAVGMEAQRVLLPGRVISSLAIREPFLVEEDGQVSAEYQDGALQLHLLAMSQDDGVQGDTVRLLNPETGNTIYAVVTGPSRARIKN